VLPRPHNVTIEEKAMQLIREMRQCGKTDYEIRAALEALKHEEEVKDANLPRSNRQSSSS
jgi:hypothetical protein